MSLNLLSTLSSLPLNFYVQLFIIFFISSLIHAISLFYTNISSPPPLLSFFFHTNTSSFSPLLLSFEISSIMELDKHKKSAPNELECVLVLFRLHLHFSVTLLFEDFFSILGPGKYNKFQTDYYHFKKIYSRFVTSIFISLFLFPMKIFLTSEA